MPEINIPTMHDGYTGPFKVYATNGTVAQFCIETAEGQIVATCQAHTPDLAKMGHLMLRIETALNLLDSTIKGE